MNSTEMNSEMGADGNDEWLSCLADGELDSAGLEAGLSATTPDEVSERWRAYLVIGDVLRSSEPGASRCDAQWLGQLRQRLQAQAQSVTDVAAPHAVAPELLRQPAANDGVFRWKMVAGLASFAAVAAVGWNLFGTLQPTSSPAAAVLAQNENPRPAAETRTVALQQSRALQRFWSPTQAPYTMVLRNPELDRVLAQQASSAPDPAVQRTSDFLRSAGYGTAER